MNTTLRVATWALWLLPLSFAAGAAWSPPPASQVLWITLAFMLLVYASVWLVWRPSRFVLDGRALRIVWPTWSRTIERGAIREVSLISGNDFRQQFGYGMRIGAGGLWGGFGLLKTGRETFSMWVSRTDRFVIVRLDGTHRPLLITPEHAERFVDALRAAPAE